MTQANAGNGIDRSGTRPDRRTAKRRIGDAAEAAAGRFLASRGLVPLARQYLRRVGELDLVMVQPGTGTIVFAEVRYRTSEARGGAALSVDARKCRRLRAAASAWLQRHADPRRAARIDVLGLSPEQPPRCGPERGDGRGRETGDAVLWEGYRVVWLKGAVDG